MMFQDESSFRLSMPEAVQTNVDTFNDFPKEGVSKKLMRDPLGHLNDWGLCPKFPSHVDNAGHKGYRK